RSGRASRRTQSLARGVWRPVFSRSGPAILTAAPGQRQSPARREAWMQGSSPFQEMRRLVAGHSISIAISVVAELGVPDLLADGPKTASELARRVGAHEDFLRRVLRFLASEGVFAEQPDDRFALAP